jgi:hypothetical protein
MLPIAGGQMLLVLEFWVESVAGLALDSQGEIQKMFEWLQSLDLSLQSHLFLLHLNYLLGQVLVRNEHLFVFVFEMLISLFLRRGLLQD